MLRFILDLGVVDVTQKKNRTQSVRVHKTHTRTVAIEQAFGATLRNISSSGESLQESSVENVKILKMNLNRFG